MKSKYFLVIFLISITCFIDSLKAGENTYKRSNFEGRHFIIAFPDNEIAEAGYPIQKIFISSRHDTKVSIIIDSVESIVTIKDGSIQSFEIPSEYEIVASLSGQILENKTIDIKSSHPITVSCYSSQVYSSDMFVAIPVSSWGKDYITMNMGNDFYEDNYNSTSSQSIENKKSRSGEFMILSAEDLTIVKVFPSASSGISSSFSMRLDKGESYLLKGYASTLKHVNDLTGTRVKANKPIGIVSGHMRSAVPIKEDTIAQTKDYLMEMLPPVESWGMDFVTIPWGNKMSTMYKIVASEDNTVISYEDSQMGEAFSLQAGEYRVIDNARSTGVWSASAPIMIAQFMARYIRPAPGGTETSDYDPSYAIVQPTDQYVNSVLFKTISYNEVGFDFNSYTGGRKTKQYEKHFVTVIADSAARETMTLDGIPIKSLFWPTNSPYYFYMNNPISPGDHILESPVGSFSGLLYGAGEMDSYSLILGSGLKQYGSNDETTPLIFAEVNCDILTGFVSDTLGMSSGTFNSGIFYVEMDEDESYNVNFWQDQTEDNADIVRFGAKVIDFELDARLVVNYSDEDGNFDTYVWDYFGLNVNASPKVDFGDLVKGSIAEKSFYFVNTSISRTVTVSDVIYDEDLFDISLDAILPIDLVPSQQISGTISINPLIGNDFTSEILIISSCSQTSSIPVSAQFLSIGVESLGYDFGDIILTEQRDGVLIYSNTEDVPIRILGQTFPVKPYSSSGTIIGDVILPGQSSSISVRFNAPQNYNFIEDVAFEQFVTINSSGTVGERSYTFTNNLSISGGVKYPRFVNDNINLGRVRVEQTVSRTINLNNLEDTLAFVSLIESSSTYSDFPSDDLATLLENVNGTLITKKNSAGGNYEISFDVNPMERGTSSFYSKFEYLSGDGTGNGPYRRTFSRSGTVTAFLPEAQSRDHYLGELYAGLESSTFLSLIESASEDDLSLNHLREFEYYYTSVGGDRTEITDVDEISKFPIKILNSVGGEINGELVMGYRDAISRTVSFAPKDSGYYELLLIASHDGGVWDEGRELGNDGNPIYYDTISIAALALRERIPKVIFEFDQYESYACNFQELQFSIINVGEVDIEITNVRVVDAADLSSDPKAIGSPAPIILFPDGINALAQREYTDTLWIFATRPESGQIDLRLEGIDLLYGTLFTADTSFYVEPKVNTLAIDEVSFGEGREINAFDTLTFSGSLPSPVNVGYEFEFELGIEIDRSLVEVLNNSTLINFTNYRNDIYYSVPASVNHVGDNKFFIVLEDEIKTDTLTLDWNFSLEVRYLYTSFTSTDIILESSADVCYNPITKAFPLKIPEFCIFNRRQISPFLNTSDIFPNPADTDISVELSIGREDVINIIFINNLGQKFHLDENKFVNEGYHLLYYDLGNLPAGNYLFVIEGSNVYKSKYITITK